MKRAALYVRVSSGSQTTENQERELRGVAAKPGWEIVQIYRDAGISGAKGRDEVEGPMAIVILGGLLTSMILNLLVLPTLALRYGKFGGQKTSLEGFQPRAADQR
jgi:hypothetical protein